MTASMGVCGKEFTVFFRTCWLRNRYRLVAYVVIGCALVLLGTLPVTMKSVHGHWVWVHPKTVVDAREIWRFGIEHVLFAMIFLLLFSAADLGSLGVGESAARKEYDFLLTRPRARRHFVWTAWLAGLSQLCVLTLIPLVVAVTTLYFLTSRIYPAPLWPRSLGAFILSLLVFSGAFALSVATGSSRSGFELALSLLIINYVAQQMSWHFAFRAASHGRPFSSPIYGEGAYGLINDPHLRYIVLSVMVAATAVLPFLAQLRFERKDL
jgi:ABC-type transport system involved in multi-copper enzyme maturation permease subunit